MNAGAGSPPLVPATNEHVLRAIALLRAGQIVAFPTDTVYGVGADCLHQPAVEHLFTAKVRPRGKPIALLAGPDPDLTNIVADWPPGAALLARHFWPGGLTLVVPASNRLAPAVTAGSGKVGIRVPDHPVALALIGGLGRPVAATSANLSGEASPRTADVVAASLGDRVPLILDSGPCPGGTESTVLDLTGPVPTVLRLGAIAPAALEAVLGARVSVP